MDTSQERLAKFLLRFVSPLGGLRRLPVVGRCASWVGARLVPRDKLTWVQVQSGVAKGLWLHLNPRTGKAYFDGKGEVEVQIVLQEHLRAGMTFYDLGANIGLFTLVAARMVGEKGRVVAFEADPEVAARLREHVARNQFGWTEVEERAVWSEPRMVFFARTDSKISPDRGLGHVVGNSGADTIEVAAISLDEFAAIHGAPDFIKCDVEGAEVEVFRGARRLLKEKRPGIVCEMHSPENHRALVDTFGGLGYRCTPCGTYHVLALPE